MTNLIRGIGLEAQADSHQIDVAISSLYGSGGDQVADTTDSINVLIFNTGVWPLEYMVVPDIGNSTGWTRLIAAQSTSLAISLLHNQIYLRRTEFSGPCSAQLTIEQLTGTILGDDAPINLPAFGVTLGQLQSTVAAEASARAAAVTTEQNARASADSAETNSRIAADTAESVARVAADTTEATTRAAADGAESAARIAADSGLQTQVNAKLDRSGGTMSGALTLAADATSALHAVTKQQLDNVAQGLKNKGSAKLRTVAALSPTNTYNNGTSGVGATLTAGSNGVLTVDGVAVALNDLVVVGDEASKLKNGLYLCTQAGAVGAPYILTRATNMDSDSEFIGSFVLVTGGNTKSGTLQYTSIAGSSFTVGTTALDWTASSTTPSSTDAVSEGSANLYFTEARALGTDLAGLNLSATNVAIAATDDILGAFGKLRARLEATVSNLTTEISNRGAADTSLTQALSDAVNNLIDATELQNAIAQAIANKVDRGAAISNLSLVNQAGVNLLTGDNMTDPTTGLSITAALQAIRAAIQSGGVSQPTFSSTPYVLFPGSATVTITNASPAVITWNAHGKAAGDWVQFTTTGTLPSPLVPGTIYYLIATGLTTNTFRVALTPGGAAINTTTAGSGTHTGWSSADVNETATIVGPVVATGTVTGFRYSITANGSIVATTAVGATTFSVPPLAGVGGRNLSITTLYSWQNGTDVPGPTSITYTVNAPPAIPITQTPPSFGSGTPQVGTQFTLNDGTATNSPTSHVKGVYRGWQSVNNPGTLATSAGVDQSTYTIVQADSGLQLAIGETYSNAAGTSVLDANSFSSPILIAASGGAPQWVDTNGDPLTTGTNTAGGVGAVVPFFPNNTYSAGDSGFLNLGLTVGNLATVNYQYLRDNSATNMPSGQGVTQVPFSFTSLDSGHQISCVLTPVNGAGAGRPVTVASVEISGTASGGGGGGGGGTGLLSGSITPLNDNSSGTAYNLTTEGATDWAAWMNGTFTAPDRKSGGPSRITATVQSGTDSNGSTGHYIQFLTWSDGTPTASLTADGARLLDGDATNNVAWLRIVISGVGTTQEVFRFWGLVIPGEAYNITASLSDGSATNYTFSGTGPSTYNLRFDLSFKAAASGQTLTIDIKKTSGTGHLYCQAGVIA